MMDAFRYFLAGFIVVVPFIVLVISPGVASENVKDKSADAAPAEESRAKAETASDRIISLLSLAFARKYRGNHLPR